MYPRLLIGESLIRGYLVKKDDTRKVFSCLTLSQVRDVVSDMFYINGFDGDLCIHLRSPQMPQYNQLLKFLEYSSLKIVLLVPFDNVPGVIVSRMKIIIKDEGVTFRTFLDRFQGGDIMKEKLATLFA